jgi:hypothetical protein
MTDRGAGFPTDCARSRAGSVCAMRPHPRTVDPTSDLGLVPDTLGSPPHGDSRALPFPARIFSGGAERV